MATTLRTLVDGFQNIRAEASLIYSAHPVRHLPAAHVSLLNHGLSPSSLFSPITFPAAHFMDTSSLYVYLRSLAASELPELSITKASDQGHGSP